MEPKYHMTVEQNVFVAKRNIIDYIWKSAKLEGLAVTFPDTEAIYNGINVPGLKVDEVVAINNLKHAWEFVLDTIDYPTDYAYICKINQYVGANLIMNAGYIRNVPVSIGGTTWKPDLPIEADIKDEIAAIQQIESATDRAITLMLYVMRKQIFLDGNKRTAMLAANQVLIQHGEGIISVPIDRQREFSSLLVEFYESNDMEKINSFVYDTCIDGMNFEPIQDVTRDNPMTDEKPSIRQQLAEYKKTVDAKNKTVSPAKKRTDFER